MRLGTIRGGGAIVQGWGSAAALVASGLVASCGGGGGGSAAEDPQLDVIAPAAPWTWPAILAAEPGAVRVMALGDSITVGFGSPGGYRFPLQLALEAAQVDSIDFVGGSTVNSPSFIPDPEHEGHGGWTLAELIHFDGAGAFPDSSIEQILTLHRPEVLLLHAGTNDLFEGATWQESLERLRELLERVHAFDPDIATLVAAIVPTGDPSANLLVDWYNARLRGLVHALAEDGLRLTLVDMPVEVPTFASGDGTDVHPDFDTYVAMAHAWAAGLVALGEPVPAPPEPLPVVTGVAAVASGFSGGHLPSLAVDGAGLELAPFEDLHDAEEGLGAGGLETTWRSEDFAIESDGAALAVPVGPSAPWIELTLPQATDLGALEVWNGRHVQSAGGDAWTNEDSILRVQALTSSDGVDWIDRGFVWLAPGPDRLLAPPEVIEVDWVDTRHVRLVVSALHVAPPPQGATAVATVGLSELQLRGTPSAP